MHFEIPSSNKWVRTKGAKLTFQLQRLSLNFREPNLSYCLETVKLQASRKLKMGEMTTSESQHIELQSRMSWSVQYWKKYWLLGNE